METKKLEAGAGSWFGSVAKQACEQAIDEQCNVEFDFNGILITATPGTSPATLEKYYHDESDRRHEEYINSDEYKQRKAEEDRKAAEQAAKRKAAFANAPSAMTITNQAVWDDFKAKNKDGYGGGILRYAENWARLIEGEIAKGKKLQDVASELSYLADDEGITGFMYGAAVSTLAAVWKYGDALRKWHNKDYGVDEDSDGVVNPAILTIG